MLSQKRRSLGVVLATPLVLAALAAAADHREAPLIQEDLSADINDVYAFLNPNDASRLVLAITVNPFSAPSENVTYNFSPNVRYAINIDVDGDAQSDGGVLITFSNPADGPQWFRVNVSGVGAFTGDVTLPTEEPEPNEAIIVNGPGGVTAFAGQRDDPFFFDVVGFNRFLAGTGGFTGTDGFAGFNVSAIVVELPLSLFPTARGGTLQIWGTTERRLVTLRRSSQGELQAEFGPYQQIERMGNPAINTALIPLARKDLYNIGLPENDAADFAGDIVTSLMALGTNDENIDILASVAVPDTLKLDPSMAVGYPNGRAPEDDVIDTLLFFIFNQTEVPDGVDANDKPFLDTFPYLAPPHQPA